MFHKADVADENVLVQEIDELCNRLKDAEEDGQTVDVPSILKRLEDVLEEYRKLRQAKRNDATI